MLTPAVTRSKADKVEEAKHFEINDKKGIEKSYISKYLWRILFVPRKSSSQSTHSKLRDWPGTLLRDLTLLYFL